jgi:hypothetical protein
MGSRGLPHYPVKEMAARQANSLRVPLFDRRPAWREPPPSTARTRPAPRTRAGRTPPTAPCGCVTRTTTAPAATTGTRDGCSAPTSTFDSLTKAQWKQVAAARRAWLKAQSIKATRVRKRNAAARRDEREAADMAAIEKAEAEVQAEMARIEAQAQAGGDDAT